MHPRKAVRRLPGVNPKDAIGTSKPSLALVPTGLIVQLSRVMELGAIKYGPWNWRTTNVRYMVYINAALRHLFSALDGDEIDEESGVEHIAHVAACCAIILDAKSVGTLVDDRPTKGAAAKLIKALTSAKPVKARRKR